MLQTIKDIKLQWHNMRGEVSIHLKGGLGNYLFEIACAYAYSLKYNKELVLTVNDSIVVHKHLNVYKNNILTNVKFTENHLKNSETYTEPFFHFNEIPKSEGNLYLNGHFQSDLYFKDYRNEIINLFSFPEEQQIAIKEKYKNVLDKNTCSIHVRRGDYLNSPNHHPVISLNYIMKATKQMPEDSVFVVFSDDITWCKQNLPNLPDKFVFIEGNLDYEDLLLMTLCKNNIICNSTFSWWAAWLNTNENKKVIAPKKWFGPAYSQYDLKDLYPSDWISL